MDALYFKTGSLSSVLAELGLHTDPSRDDGKYFNGRIYEGFNFLFVWIGRIPASYKIVQSEAGDIEVPDTWQPGYYFNVWVRGQAAMDRFSTLKGSQLIEPVTPNVTLL